MDQLFCQASVMRPSPYLVGLVLVASLGVASLASGFAAAPASAGQTSSTDTPAQSRPPVPSPSPTPPKDKAPSPSTSSPPMAPSAQPAPTTHGAGPTWAAPAISGGFAFLGSLLVLLAALGNTDRTVKAGQKSAEALIHQKSNETELEHINLRLTDFYAPFMLRSDESRMLIEVLRARQTTPETFRTLTALQDVGWRRTLSKADATLVQAIVHNGEELRELIRTKGGLADPAIHEHLARASTHFRLLALAEAGALDDAERLSAHVYPRELDDALRAAVDHLLARASRIRQATSSPHGLIDPLTLPTGAALPARPMD